MANRRSSISTGAVLKNFIRFIPYPRIVTKLCALQTEKLLFNRFYPNTETGRAKHIRQVSFRVTDRCNLRCHTCGQWGDSGFLHDKPLKELIGNEVTPERYIEILEDLVKHKHRPLVYIWGGEPMLYPGILRLLEAASRLGLPASIATNGTHIDSEAENLVRMSMFLIHISIDGHNAGLHNRMRPGTGKQDNFADIEAGLEAIKRSRRDQGRRLPLVAALTVISKENAEHLVDIYEVFKDRVDLFVFYLSWWITPERAEAQERNFASRFGFTPKMHRGWVGNWQPDDYGVLNDQLQSLLIRSRALSATPVTIIPPITGTADLRTYYSDHASLFGFDQCVSIYQAVEVDSNGDMTPCRDYRDYIVGNIKEYTISDLWNSEAYRNFRKNLATEGLMPVCSRCCGLMGY